MPKDSFWVLIESRDMATWSIDSGNESLLLPTGVWHCLPQRWRSAVETAKQAALGDWSPVRIETN